MTELFQDPSDAELLARYRDGDDDAAALLFERHHPAAVRLATSLAGHSYADDLASDAFFGALRAVRNGAGPEFAFRPYLLTSVRNGFYRASKVASRQDLYDDIEQAPLPSVDDGSGLREESSLLAEAFATLPERWQAVLWHTTIHDESPEEVARTLGIKPNAVSSLALRAREGLRNAYLTAHLGRTDDPACREVRGLLPAYDRGKLRARPRAKVDAHLGHCAQCSEAASLVRGITANLGILLLPAVLGAPGVAAFGTAAKGAAAAGATAAVGGGTAAVSSGVSAAGVAGSGGIAGTGIVGNLTIAAVLAAGVAVGAAGALHDGDATAPARSADATQEAGATRTPSLPSQDGEPEPTAAPRLAPVAELIALPTPFTAGYRLFAQPRSAPGPTRPTPTSTRTTRPETTAKPTPSTRPRPRPSTRPRPTATPVRTPDEDLSITAEVAGAGIERVVTLRIRATRDVPQVTITRPPKAWSWGVLAGGWTCNPISTGMVCRASGTNPRPIIVTWTPKKAPGFAATITSPSHSDPNPGNNTVTVN